LDFTVGDRTALTYLISAKLNNSRPSYSDLKIENLGTVRHRGPSDI